MSAAPVRVQSSYAAVAARKQISAHGLPGTATNPTGNKPRLQVVATPTNRKSLLPLAIVCSLVLLAALATVLIINTVMVSGSYAARDANIEIARLHQERAALLFELETAAAPQNLAAAARALGMQETTQLGYISLAEGVVVQRGIG